MRILTISASPYLLSKLGRINSCLLKHFKNAGNEVSAACWYYDKSYFLADDDGKFYFDLEDRVCQIHPIDYDVTKSVKQVYEIIKNFQPDVVLSIGDYFETDFIHAIKSIYPRLFKWVAILTTNSYPIEKSHKDLLRSIDEAIVTTEDGIASMNEMLVTSAIYCNPGYENSIFYQDSKPDNQLTIVANLKNSQASNIPAFILGMKALGEMDVNFKAYLHTNLYDKGDYDIRRLVKEYNLGNYLILPEMFCSLQEGPPNEYLRNLYSKSHIVVDPSLKSASGMNVLEAIGCGCFPIVSKVGALKDIVNQSGFGWFISGNRFIGERHQEMEVISDVALADQICRYYWEVFRNGKNEKRWEYSDKISQRFSQEGFVIEVEKAIGRSVGSKQPILAVDVLT